MYIASGDGGRVRERKRELVELIKVIDHGKGMRKLEEERDSQFIDRLCTINYVRFASLSTS